jgi:hypothetical protein
MLLQLKKRNFMISDNAHKYDMNDQFYKPSSSLYDSTGIKKNATHNIDFQTDQDKLRVRENICKRSRTEDHSETLQKKSVKRCNTDTPGFISNENLRDNINAVRDNRLSTPSLKPYSVKDPADVPTQSHNHQSKSMLLKNGTRLFYKVDQKGQINGEAKAFLENGTLVKFNYSNGIPQGKVVESQINGDLEYEIVMGQRHGKATLTYPNHGRMEFNYVFGSKEGEAVLTYPDGSKCIFTHRNDIRDGKVYFLNSLILICIGEYKNGHFEYARPLLKESLREVSKTVSSYDPTAAYSGKDSSSNQPLLQNNFDKLMGSMDSTSSFDDSNLQFLTDDIPFMEQDTVQRFAFNEDFLFPWGWEEQDFNS